MSSNSNASKTVKAICLILFAILLFSGASFSQYVIKGQVTGENGAPLAGATISEKGAVTGTTTQENGTFELSVSSADALLIASYVGYQTREIRVNNQLFVNVNLTSASASLDSVVVIGYGTAQKKDITGAISSIKEKYFNNGNYISPELLIQGKVPGVQICRNTGQPGDATTIKIRGNSALTGTGAPLFVIDGVPLDGRALAENSNPLNFVNPDDIASIDILKDASATAIYGARAAYGVIIINTKKGQTGATRLEVEASAGVSSLLKKLQVLNASDFRSAIKYYGLPSSFDKGSNVDAQDAICQNGSQQNYSVAGSGGTENGNYRFSVGYFDQTGLMILSSFKRYSADVNASFKVLDSKKLGLDLNLNSSQYTREGTPDIGLVMTGALQWNPTESLTNADGSLNLTSRWNPVAFLNFAKFNFKGTTILGSISPSYKFTNWLEYKLLMSVNYSSGISRHSLDQRFAITFRNGYTGEAGIDNDELITQQITHTLEFKKEIFKDLRVNAVAGFEYMKFTHKSFGLGGNGVGGVGFGNFGLDYTNYVQYSDIGSRTIYSFIDPKSELQSFFGRTIFNYAFKYFLTATLRADGSTKFGSNNKYGYFPSFAAAWIVNKENFFKIDFINSLKLRLGWGITGNQEFPAGSSQALYGFGGNGTIHQVNNPNPNLKWQSDRQFNVGIDFSIFKDRISGTLDYFDKATTNLLFPSPIFQPSPPGSGVIWLNLDGKIENKGLEVQINSLVIRHKKFGLDLSVNATFLRNNVSDLQVPLYTGWVGGASVEIIQNGHPIDAYYTRKFIGLDKGTGFSVYEGGYNAFYYVGNPNPKAFFGISTTFRYKKLFLTANMNGACGQDIFNVPLYNTINVANIQGGGNIGELIYRNPVKESPANPVTPSSRFIFTGNYLKMGDITMAYDLGEVAKTFEGAKLYFTVQNAFVITNYPGYDPEVNTNASVGGVPSNSIDYQHYPSARIIIFGIHFSL